MVEIGFALSVWFATWFITWSWFHRKEERSAGMIEQLKRDIERSQSDLLKAQKMIRELSRGAATREDDLFSHADKL